MDYLKITYKNTKDIGGEILYQNGFENVIYLDAYLKKPLYPIVEDGEENDDADFVPTFTKWEKTYSFEVWVSEYMVDALTAIPLHDYIWIDTQEGEGSQVYNTAVDVEWEDLGDTEQTNGCFAKVTVTFTTSSLKVTNCDQNINII